MTTQRALSILQLLDNLDPRTLPDDLLSKALDNAPILEQVKGTFARKRHAIAMKHALRDDDDQIIEVAEDDDGLHPMEQQTGIRLDDGDAFQQALEGILEDEAAVDLHTLTLAEAKQTGASLMTLSRFRWMIEREEPTHAMSEMEYVA